MITVYNIQNVTLSLNVELSGGGSTRTLTIQPFANGQITEAEYTQNPDYYNELVTHGQISMTAAAGNKALFDVEDEPLNHQIGSAVSGV